MNKEYLSFKLRDNGNIDVLLDDKLLLYYDKELNRVIIEKTLDRITLSLDSLEEISSSIINYKNQLNKIDNIRYIIEDMFREE